MTCAWSASARFSPQCSRTGESPDDACVRNKSKSRDKAVSKGPVLSFLLVGGSLDRVQTTLGQPLGGGRGARRHGSTRVQPPEPRPPWDRRREHILVVAATGRRVLKTPTQPRTRRLDSPRAGVLCQLRLQRPDRQRQWRLCVRDLPDSNRAASSGHDDDRLHGPVQRAPRAHPATTAGRAVRHQHVIVVVDTEFRSVLLRSST